jgi:DNA-binding XRE family transcriptional regulator
MASTSNTLSPLRARRLECGLTQAELAARAGVSRQLIAAVEAGLNAPAVDAALALARALATTVEDLFSPATLPVTPALGDRLPHGGAALRVGRVGEQLVAAELPDHGTAGAAWAKADGILDGSALRLFPGTTPAGLVLAGCDPALGIAEAMLQGLGPRSLLAISAATGTALTSLKRGRVHAAVVHGPEDDLPRPPVPVVRLQLARWQVGLAVAPAPNRASLEALLEGHLLIVQRDPAAASQQAFKRAATKTGVVSPPPGPRAAGHIDAARIAATLDCAAVTTEAAASAFGLRFIALEHHTVQIWLAERWLDNPAANALGNLLASAAFTERVAHFGGYDLAECGNRVEPR